MIEIVESASADKMTIAVKNFITKPSRNEKRTVEVKALTGIRGIAAIDVALGHFNINNLYYINMFVFHDAAVDIFFALSSFTLFMVYGTKGKINWRDFAVSRFARVYPLYFIVTLIGVYLNAYGQIFQLSTPSGQDMIKHLLSQLFMTAQLPIPSIAGFYLVALWSVPIEAFCYIFIFAPLRWISPRICSSSSLLVLVVLSTFTVLILYVKHFNPIVNSVGVVPPADLWAYWLPSFRGILMFTAGWAVFKVYEQERSFAQALGIATNAIALSILAVITTGETFGMIRKEFIVTLVPFLIVSLMNPNSFTAKLLALPPIYYLGKISFSIYLLHLPVYIEVLYYFPLLANKELFRIGVPLATTLLISPVSYHLIEDPARRLIKWALATSSKVS